MVRLYLLVGMSGLLSAAIVVAAKVIAKAMVVSAYRFSSADPATLSLIQGFVGFPALEYFLLVPALLFILLGAYDAAREDRSAGSEGAKAGRTSAR